MLSHCSCVWLFANPLAVALQAPLSGGSPGKNDSVDSHSILQEIFPTQGLNSHLSCLLHIYIHMWKSLSRVRLFATSWTVAYQAPPSMGFSRQEYWSGLPFPSPGDLPDPGIEPGSPAFQADALTSEPEVTYLNWIQFRYVTQLCPTFCDPTDCSTPGFPVHHQLLEFTQTHVHRVGAAIQPSHPLSSFLTPFPPALNLSQHQGLSKWVSSSLRWPKYWNFCFSISPSNEYSGLISFKMDWLDLLAVQGTLKSLLHHHSSKAAILRSAFFIDHLSHPYMAAGKTTALTKWTFVGKVMSLLFNKLSRWSQLSSQGISVFEFHGCSHHLQWFWSPNK